ncbi:MAG: type II toxin-antitoxin system HicA family toxin [Candidatus Marinimicrobia bacterium]|nr:type II toxin-antitoxin system HicA family toxin [Candidatus Neomarinimicrobiota bacterium]
MSKKDKLLLKIQKRPKDFTWEELTRLLKSLGYKLVKTGKTGGSRRRFIHPTAPPINLHKPHPQNIIKQYIINDILDLLKEEEMI